MMARLGTARLGRRGLSNAWALWHPRLVPARLLVTAIWASSLAALAPGCLIDRAALGAPGEDAAVGPGADAYAAPGTDAALDARRADLPDASVPATDDAWAPDAYVLPPDAFAPPDAPAPACVPVLEECNALDDDCDGTVDDGACFVRTTGGDSVACTTLTRAGRSYLFCRPTAGWNLARTLCMGFAGGAYDLVSFSDGAEQDAVRGLLERNAWMGLSDDPARISGASDEDYRWLDGARPSYTAWDSGEPSTARTAGCVLLRMDGTWDAASCDEPDNTASFVCEAAIR